VQQPWIFDFEIKPRLNVKDFEIKPRLNVKDFEIKPRLNVKDCKGFSTMRATRLGSPLGPLHATLNASLCTPLQQQTRLNTPPNDASQPTSLHASRPTSLHN
jgi:hypothetical protein